MIKIKRDRVPKPTILSSEAASEERAEAEAFYSNPLNESESFKGFKVYKSEEVRKALQTLFHGKCAYCESKYLAVLPADVEHWKPKGMVLFLDSDVKIRPGFWEEASEWSNLFPSCIDCNRRRTQQIYEPTLYPANSEVLGKGNLFPVSSAKQPRTLAELQVAEPLLLNPCSEDPEDDPAEHLDFKEDGAVLPKKFRGQSSEKGHASIVTYGLHRSGLFTARHEHALLVRLRLHSIEVLIRALETAMAASNTADSKQGMQLILEELLFQEILFIERARRDQSQYAQLTRQIVERFMADTGIQLPQCE